MMASLTAHFDLAISQLMIMPTANEMIKRKVVLELMNVILSSFFLIQAQ